MITVNNISKTYGKKTVLDNVSAAFPAHQLTALIGPNGAGKSTLLMTIARQLETSQGEIQLNGQAIEHIRHRDFAKRVATLCQFPQFNLRLKVEELVAFGRFPYSQGRLSAEDYAEIDAALDFLSLNDLRHAYLDELSGGQRQMAFLAMTIAQQTDCLLLDEPLNNLDIRHAVQIMQALRRLCDERGRTVILVVHDINFAANYADHIVAMKHGAIHCAGPVHEVLTNTQLQSLYGLHFEITRNQNGHLCNYFNLQENKLCPEQSDSKTAQERY